MTERRLPSGDDAVTGGPPATPARLPKGDLAFASPTPRSTWSVSCILVFAMAAGTFAGFAVGALGPALRDDFDVSRTAIGGLVTIFYLVGAAGSISAGTLSDVIGPRRALSLLFLVSGVALMAMGGLATNYAWLVLAVAFGGIAHAGVNPVTNNIVASMVAPRWQGTVIGMKQAGVQVGAFVAGSLLPLGALAFGWRPTAMSIGLLVGLGAVATRFVIPDITPVRNRTTSKTTDRTRSIVTWMSPYGFLMAGGMAFNAAYLPLFANEVLGVSASRAGLLVAVFGGCGVLGRVVWGWAAGATRSPIPLLALIAAGSIVSQALIWGSPAIGLWALWMGAAVLGLSAIAWLSVGMVVLVRNAGEGDLGRGTGVVQLWFYAGFAVFPLIAGVTIDRAGTYGYGWAISIAAFTASLIVAISWTWRARMSPKADQTHA